MTLDETTVTQSLDERGLLSASRKAGVYAMLVDVPDEHDAVTAAWDTTHDTRPPGNALTRLTAASRVAYVGASSNMYERLCDHAIAEDRQAAFLEAFPPEEVVDVWPHANPFDAEFNRAMRLVQNGWVVWTDGELLG